MNPYDDPYIMLVYWLIANLNAGDLRRVLEDDEFVLKMIIKETRWLDFKGPFLDTIVCSLLEDKRRMEMCHELDKLSEYFFSQLDLGRLRRELLLTLNKYDIKV